MTASGTFGYGLEYSSFGDLSRLGGLVVKGLSLEPRQGNPSPRIAETPCGLLNSIGLHNIGARSFLEDKLPRLPWQETAVMVNLYGQTADEFAGLAELFADRPEIAGLEVNISCPNVQAGGTQFGQDPKAAAEVCRTVKARAGATPVMVKLSPNVTDIREVATAVEEAGADLISLINTLSGMAVDIRSRRPKLGNVVGGLSGPAIKPVALRMVHAVCQSVSLPVVGIGGIVSAEDILEFILVGAQAVQIGTANFIRPDTSFYLVDELERAMAELGLEGLDELRGSLRLE
jgi:dihydroorotate dehydrogenase (NAD+) catalytic subunit